MNPKNYVVETVNGRKKTKRRPELRNLTKRQQIALDKHKRSL